MLNIVLFQPEIPQNTGNIARTCTVTGSRLILVRPLGFSLDEKHLKRAGLDYWNELDLEVMDSDEEFFSRCRDKKLIFFSARSRLNYFDISFEKEKDEDIFMIFGRESAGLGRELIEANIERCFRLPLRKGERSLNLSNSVAVAVFEYYRQLGFPAPFEKVEKQYESIDHF